MTLQTKWLAGLLTAVALVGGLDSAQAGFITFGSDAPGNKPNGFVSNDSAAVSFSDSLGADLFVDDFGNQSIGRGLAVFGDDASQLIMNFTAAQNSLSLVFGNDDPNFSEAGDVARLTLFDGATQVGQVTVVMNRNDDADQTISYSGAAFTSARFDYARGNDGIGLIEVVDNIQFEAAAANAVPAPPAAILLAIGAVGLAGGRALRRRLKPVAV